MNDISTHSIQLFYNKKYGEIPKKELETLEKLSEILNKEVDRYKPSPTSIEIILEASQELDTLGV